jgi:hypothetical protein
VIPPSDLLIQLRNSQDQPVPEVLVALHFSWHGRFYYAHALGLSDGAGQVRVSDDELLSTFRAQQQQFPMDLKVPLAECDSTVKVNVMGGAEFLSHRSTLVPGWVTPDWIARWNRARNDHFESNASSIAFDDRQSLRHTVILRPVNEQGSVRAV